MLLTVIVILAVIALVVAIAAVRPAEFRVARSTTVSAPPERILPLIGDFRRWTDWSPYEQLDPQMKKSYAGASSGVGAVYEWDGKKAGSGRMEILEVTPSKVTIKLDFTKPMTAHNTAEFTVEPQGGATRLTWAMHGRNALMAKVMSLFISMDKLVGKDFETGVANLKAIAER
jgi:carbon monoxide dehydrogenase subunit G